MYYVSMADNHTGRWLGGCFVDAPTDDEAGAIAVRIATSTLTEGRHCIEAVICEAPAVWRHVPPDMRGRLLNTRELEWMGAVKHLVSDGENLKEAPPSPRPS